VTCPTLCIAEEIVFEDIVKEEESWTKRGTRERLSATDFVASGVDGMTQRHDDGSCAIEVSMLSDVAVQMLMVGAE
jgi:hypothetical protein